MDEANQDLFHNLLGHGVMGEEEPESEYGLGEDVKDSIGNDLSIYADVAGSISDTPDATSGQRLFKIPREARQGIHWVDGPKDEGEASNGGKEGGGLLVLALYDTATIETELIDNDQVGNACHGIPSPHGSLIVDGEGGKETGQDHDEIGDNSNEDIGTSKTSQEGEIEEEKWGCQTPVDISRPVNLSVDDLLDIWEVLLGVGEDNFVLANTIIDSHRVVGEGGEGCDERCQDMEHAFLLDISVSVDPLVGWGNDVSGFVLPPMQVRVKDVRLGHGRPSHRRRWRRST